MKKAISLFIVLSIVLMSLTGITLVGSAEAGATIEFDGVTYETISSTEEFVAKLSANTADGVTTGNYAIVTDNIVLDQTLESGAYVPFAKFSGTIVGFNDEGTAEALRAIEIKVGKREGDSAGIFGELNNSTIRYIKTTGTIKDVTLKGGHGAGTFAYTGTAVTFEYCENAATVNVAGASTCSAGGFIGRLPSSGSSYFNYCKNTGAVTATGTPGAMYIGGFVGSQTSGNLYINNSVNYADITSGSQTGGLAGHIASAQIRKSANLGNISGYGSVGGLVGSVHNNKNPIIATSYNKGNIHSTNGRGGTTQTQVAGLFGYVGVAGTTNVTTIVNSYSSGTLTYTEKSTHTTSVAKIVNTGESGTVKVQNVYSISEGAAPLMNNVSATIVAANCYYLAEADGERVNGVQALSDASMRNLEEYSETVADAEGAEVTYSFDSETWAKNGVYPYIQLVDNYQPIEVTQIAAPVIDSVKGTENGYVISWNAINDPFLSEYKVTVSDSEGNVVYDVTTTETSYTAVLDEDKAYVATVVALSEYEGATSEASEYAFSTYFAGGEGTAEAPYVITNAKQFAKIALYPSAEYYLASDITLDQTLESGAYIPVSVFSGKLTGMKADLSGEEVRTITVKSAEVGLFTAVSGATLKNLKVDGEINSESGKYVAAFAGTNTGDSALTTIENCENKADVFATGVTGGAVAGFIANNDSVLVINSSVNNGNIEFDSNIAGSYCSGFVAYNTNKASKSVEITNCVNNGNITGSTNAGAFAAQTRVLTVKSSANTGKITSNMNAGGIVGSTFSSSIVKIYTSYNAGDIAATAASSRKTPSVGGLIGTANGTVTVTDSYNIGSLSYEKGTLGYVPVYGEIIAGHTGSGSGTSLKKGTITISTSYAATGSDKLFAVENAEGLTEVILTDCYYLAEATGEAADGLKALSSSDMKKKEDGTNNFSGFDFESKWTYDENGIYEYPQIIGNIQPVVVKAITTPVFNDVAEGENGYVISWNTINDSTLAGYNLVIKNAEGDVVTDETVNATSYTANLPADAEYTATLTAISKFEGGNSESAEITFNTYFADGEGTESDPYIIANERHFNNIKDKAIAKTVYFKLANDLTLGNKEENISFKAFPLVGHFDGNNKAINIYINETTTEHYTTDVGLFTVVDGSVKNLTINGEITAEIVFTEKVVFGVAGVAGSLSAGAVVDNVINNADITNRCTGSDGDKVRAGGIYGTANGAKISNCVNNGDIICSSGTVGGMGAYINAGTSTFKNCVNNGYVSGSYVGGLLARLSRGTIDGCINNGNVSGSNHAAGILGSHTHVTADVTVSNSVNNGQICTSDEGKAGGIVAQKSTGALKITSCANFGPVFVNKEYTNNPIISADFDAVITDCSYLAFDASYDDGINGAEGEADPTALKTAADFTNGELENFALIEIAENEITVISSEGKKFYALNGEVITLNAIAEEGYTDYTKVEVSGAEATIDGSKLSFVVSENAVLNISVVVPEFEMLDAKVYDGVINLNEFVYAKNNLPATARSAEYAELVYAGFEGALTTADEYGFILSEDETFDENDTLVPVSKKLRKTGVYFFGKTADKTYYLKGYIKNGEEIKYSNNITTFNLRAVNK